MSYCLAPGTKGVLTKSQCCRKKDPFHGPRGGSCLALGDTRADKAGDFIGKGHLGGEQQDGGNQEDCSGGSQSRVL